MSSFFVSECFHWIGFHIVNHLLQQGCSVTGCESPMTPKQEHLEMMIGRNDLFSLLPDHSSAARYTYAILTEGDMEVPRDMDAKKTLQLSREKLRGEERGTVIQIPLLFGEWMPMNEDGIYAEKQFIPFNSKTFQNEAVYIEDFIASLMLCLKSSWLPETLIIKPKSERASKEENTERVVYLREPRALEKQIKKVTEHYKRFKELY